MRPIATDVARSVVCLCVSTCVCVLATRMHAPAKTAERVEMPFVRLTQVDPRNHVLDGVEIQRGNEQFWGVRPIEKHWESLLRSVQRKGSVNPQ